MLPKLRQVDEPVNRTKQMIRRNMPLQTELAKQRLLLHPAFTHHQLILDNRNTESDQHNHFKNDFFNSIGRLQTLGAAGSLLQSRHSFWWLSLTFATFHPLRSFLKSRP
jgi:hypothetical protein